ncbi:hypothetical protein [Lentzea sp. NPDC051838]|uniref:hypothetical protein n=1 Tax=Lentzea sp. NPDC051838 TaxID=3154849 RepID=UPI00343A2158
MKAILVGMAVGYVLGAKAGRERYDQIVRIWHRFVESPTVRNAAHQAKDKAVGAAHLAAEKAPWRQPQESNGQPVR